jgi:hypothetical protein
MTYFTENSLWMIFVGIAVEAVLGVILFRTGRGKTLWAMIAVAVLLIVGVTVEKLIVTEKEEVENTLDGIMAALEANDLDRVLGYIAPEARSTQERARWAMDHVIVESATMYRLDITVNRLTSPHTAHAEFFGHIAYRGRKAEIPSGNYGSPFYVDFRKEGNRWLVFRHTEENEMR